jgi:hypothetical protein
MSAPVALAVPQQLRPERLKSPPETGKQSPLTLPFRPPLRRPEKARKT